MLGKIRIDEYVKIRHVRFIELVVLMGIDSDNVMQKFKNVKNAKVIMNWAKKHEIVTKMANFVHFLIITWIKL